MTTSTPPGPSMETGTVPCVGDTSTCGTCREPIRCDDNGAGTPIWVHEFGSTVCHDNPPGSLDGDVLYVATPA